MLAAQNPRYTVQPTSSMPHMFKARLLGPSVQGSLNICVAMFWLRSMIALQFLRTLRLDTVPPGTVLELHV